MTAMPVMSTMMDKTSTMVATMTAEAVMPPTTTASMTTAPATRASVNRQSTNHQCNDESKGNTDELAHRSHL